MLEAEPAAELCDGLRLLGAFGPKPMIDGRRLDARVAAPLGPFGRHQQERG